MAMAKPQLQPPVVVFGYRGYGETSPLVGRAGILATLSMPRNHTILG